MLATDEETAKNHRKTLRNAVSYIEGRILALDERIASRIKCMINLKMSEEEGREYKFILNASFWDAVDAEEVVDAKSIQKNLVDSSEKQVHRVRMQVCEQRI